MKTLVHLIAIVALAVPLSAGPAWAGHAKSLPPAFDKELVPDRSSADHKAPAAEIEERIEEENEERAVERPRQHRHGKGEGRGGRIRIHLDGDEDGGGDSLDGDL